MSTDFILERRLHDLDSVLHEKFQNSVFAIERILESYKKIFPTFTDHSFLHSMTVINYCGQLIDEYCSKLNADEIYVLLMACYLHDTGMGMSATDYPEFAANLGLDCLEGEEMAYQIRKNHHDFSAQFIKKYADFFEIPSDEHTRAICQISRGHRKTDLFNEEEFSSYIKVPNGNTLCIPYLTAIMRVADEIDVANDRNPSVLFNGIKLENQDDIVAFSMHEAIKELIISKDYIELHIEADEQVFTWCQNQNKKLMETINYCKKVVCDRTKYKITQNRIEVIRK